MAKCSSSDLVRGRGYKEKLSLSLSPKIFHHPLIQTFFGFIKLDSMHLDSTLGGLGSYSLDTCPIGTLLVGFSLGF